MLTAVSNDISQANVKAVNDARSDPRNRPLLRQSSSMAFQHFSDEVRLGTSISLKIQFDKAKRIEDHR